MSLLDYTLNKICSEGGQSLKRVSPFQGNTLCISPSFSLCSPLSIMRNAYFKTITSSYGFPLLFCLSFRSFFHATPLWLRMDLIHSTWEEDLSVLLHYSSCCCIFHLCNCKQNELHIDMFAHIYIDLERDIKGRSSGKKQSWSEKEKEPVGGVDKTFFTCRISSCTWFWDYQWQSGATLVPFG